MVVFNFFSCYWVCCGILVFDFSIHRQVWIHSNFFLQTKVVHQRQKLFCAFVPTKSHPLIIHCYGPKTNLSISILQIKDYLMFLSLSNRERIDFLLTLHSTSASMIENWTANIFKRPKISKNTNLYVYVAFQRHMITWSKCLWYDDKIFSSKN